MRRCLADRAGRGNGGVGSGVDYGRAPGCHARPARGSRFQRLLLQWLQWPAHSPRATRSDRSVIASPQTGALPVRAGQSEQQDAGQSRRRRQRRPADQQPAMICGEQPGFRGAIRAPRVWRPDGFGGVAPWGPPGNRAIAPRPSCSMLSRFRATWTPIRVKTPRQGKSISPDSDSIRTEALMERRRPPGLVPSVDGPHHCGDVAGAAGADRLRQLGDHLVIFRQRGQHPLRAEVNHLVAVGLELHEQ